MKQRHIVLSLLVGLAVITFLDRLCIAVAGPRMQENLGISPEGWGLVLGSFVLAYGLFEIPTGVMGDRSGQRRTLTRIVLWWSAFTALTGSVSGLYPLIAVRFLFGAGEAGAYPNMAGVVSRWFPVREHARAQGFIWGASRAGGALAPLLVVPIQMAFGWRAMFWIFGSLGVMWCVIWWRWFRDWPKEHPSMTEAELREIGPTLAEAGGHHAPWGLLARSRQLWTIILMYGCYAWGSWFYFSWLHTYLVRGRGFSEGEMAIFSALPFVVGAAANIAGGYLSDWATRRMGLRRGRTMVGAAALAVSACLLVATGLSTSKTAAIALLTAGFGVMDLMLPSAWALCLDVGGRYAGAVTGAMNTAGQFGGFLCTVVFGLMVGRFGDYDAPLFVIAGMLAASAFLMTRIDATRPLVPVEQAPSEATPLA
jgi:MFS transporter, ACS family, glucarate transporter